MQVPANIVSRGGLLTSTNYAAKRGKTHVTHIMITIIGRKETKQDAFCDWLDLLARGFPLKAKYINQTRN